MTRDAEAAGALGAAATSAGASALATAATACCVGPVAAPLVVSVLGATGAAWAAGLKPYSPLLLAGSGVLLAWALRSVYRPLGTEACSVSPTLWHKVARLVTWTAGSIWIAALVVHVVVE